MITPEDVRAVEKERDRERRRELGDTFPTWWYLWLAAAILLLAFCGPDRAKGQTPPDSFTVVVSWARVGTFPTYDVELLRSLDCEETPADIRQGRGAVGDVDASFRELRPPPGAEWCYLGRVRVTGVFDCPDGTANGCPAPWGSSPILAVRTGNPPPPSPDVGIDTVSFVLGTGAPGDTLGFAMLLREPDGPIDPDTVRIQWTAAARVVCGDGAPPSRDRACLGGTATLAEPGHVAEVCTRAIGCHCPPSSGNLHCPCIVDRVSEAFTYELVSPGGRLEVRPHMFQGHYVDGSPVPFVAYDANGGKGVCLGVRRVS